jgi:hypothetical protein
LPKRYRRTSYAATISAQSLRCCHPRTANKLSRVIPTTRGSRWLGTTQFQTNETKVTLIRILPRQSATLDTQGLSQLVVVLDDVGISDSDDNSRKILHTGDFLWREPAVRRTFSPTIVQTRYVLFPLLFNKQGLQNNAGWLSRKRYQMRLPTSMKCHLNCL